jgi:uncharacterized protein YhjY with autotransporter beta-barrel domain
MPGGCIFTSNITVKGVKSSIKKVDFHQHNQHNQHHQHRQRQTGHQRANPNWLSESHNR